MQQNPLRYRITLEGVVQGVGFRPFTKRLADRFDLPGITFNTAGGLIIEIETDQPNDALHFLEALKAEAPAAAQIEQYSMQQLSPVVGYKGFQIITSAARDQSFTLISTDLATCPACLEEMRNQSDRRFRYPFTNCTNCGPRYSITVSTPYDRANTTMRQFQMCSECAEEYNDSSNRRFHAEPIACPRCGPQLSGKISEIVALLETGRIAAIKGLGGYQLACNAFCPKGVDELRMRKRRSRKPFAVMMRDPETVEQYCVITEPERQLLLSAAAP